MRRSPLGAGAAVALLALALAAAACTDLRDYRGDWAGPRVGESPALARGIASDATAALTIDAIDRYGLSGRLSVDGVIDDAAVTSIEGAEADVLASLTFDGTPARVYLAFVTTVDASGDALAVVAIFDDARIEVRLLRGGARPLYGIFALGPR